MKNMNVEWIVHICEKGEWEKALAGGEYRSASLDDEGFIHCSRPEQILEVANAFYSGMLNLVLLCINPDRIEAALRWESVEGQTFPHVYGPINLDSIINVYTFLPDEDGKFRVLPEC